MLLEPLSEAKGQMVKTQIKKDDLELDFEVYYDRMGDYLIAYTTIS